MAGLNVQYLDTDTFIISGGDYTQTFVPGRRVKLNCGINGYAFGTIESAIVSGGSTYVNLTSTSDPLSASCDEAWYGIVSQGVDGSVPIHSHDGAEGSGGLVQCCEDEPPTVQALYSLEGYNYATLPSYSVLPFNVTDVETDSSVISHDPVTNNSRITFLEAGLYQVGFTFNMAFEADASTETHVEAYVRLNGSIPISASWVHDGNYYSATGAVSEDTFVHNAFVYEFQAGDYIEVLAGAENLRTVTGFQAFLAEPPNTFWATRLEGVQGPIGPSGSGSTINVKSDSILVSGSPFQILNFEGFDVTPVSGGQVNISGGSLIKQVVTKNMTGVLTSTSTIDMSSTPTNTDGTAFDNESITMIDGATNSVRIQITLPWDCDDDNDGIVLLLIRNTTVIGVFSDRIAKKDKLGAQISIDQYDSPGTGTHTYYLRVGSENGKTIYVNRTSKDATPWGGTLYAAKTWFTLTEIDLT